jgi:4,5-dihydroxyphthalate decarboxylase
MGWAMISLPWLGQEEEATREVMGDNFWPYGIEQNRRTLDALLQYAYEQGSLARELAADEIFHESTVALSDSPPGSA